MSKQHFAMMCLITAFALAGPSANAQWTTTLNLSNTPGIFSGNQTYVFDAQGTIHMVWEDFLDGFYRLYYTTNAGGSWTPSALMDLSPGSHPVMPRLCITPDQVLHLFYKRNNRMYEITRPVSGGPWSAAVQLDTHPSGGYIVDAEVDGTGGIYFAWLHLFDDSVSPPSAVWGRYKPFGGSWGPVELVCYGGREDFPEAFNLVAQGPRIIGVYGLYKAPRYKVYENGAWGPQKTVSSSGGGPRMAFAPNGEWACAYGYDPPGDEWFQVYVRFSYDQGATWTPELNISNGPWLNRSVEIVYDANSNLHVAYQRKDSDPVQFDMYYTARIGGLWQNTVVLSSPQNLRAGAPLDALKTYGNDVHFTYTETVDGYEDVYYRMKPGAAVPPPGSVTEFSAVAGENRALLSWKNPSDQYYAATMVRVSASGFPSGPFAGTYVCLRTALPGSSDSFLMYPLSAGVPQYFAAFAQDALGQWSPAAQAVAVPLTDVTPPSPVNSFAASAMAVSGQIALTWTNPSDIDFKGTTIRFGTEGFPSAPSDGALVCSRTASPGSADSFVHTGLTPGLTYYYTAFARDAEPNYSAGASAQAAPIAMTCAAAKQWSDNTSAVLESKIVSANFVGTDGCIYICEPDGSSGIRVVTSQAGLAVGDAVNVTGSVTTRVLSSYPAERQISSAAITKLSSGSARDPVGMSCRCVGGAALDLAPGVRDGIGLNNMGLLVRIAGRVTYKSGQYLFVDDGSRIPNLFGTSTQTTGVMVKCPSSSIPVVAGDVVSVTGIVEGSVPNNPAWTTNRAYIHMRSWNDLVSAENGPVTGSISGFVRDGSGSGIAGASVSTNVGGYSTISGAGGSYALSGVLPGTYSVTASKAGYTGHTVSGVVVNVGQSSSVNFTLSLTLTEKLTNGNFEGGFFYSGWWGGYCANGWGFAWRGSPANNSFYCDSHNAGSPHGIVQKVQGKVDNFDVGIAQEITGLTPGAPYTFSAESYRVGSNYQVFIAVRPGVGYSSEMGATTGTQFPSTTGAWVSQSVSGTVASQGSVTAYLWVKRLSGSTADVYFDNASFTSW